MSAERPGQRSPAAPLPAGDADLAETGSISSSGLGESAVFHSPDSKDAEVQPKCIWTTAERPYANEAVVN